MRRRSRRLPARYGAENLKRRVRLAGERGARSIGTTRRGKVAHAGNGGFEGEDGFGFVEGGAVHLGCDGVAGEKFCAERAGPGGSHAFSRPSRRITGIGSWNGRFRLSSEDCEVDRPFGSLKCVWFARVDDLPSQTARQYST